MLFIFPKAAIELLKLQFVMISKTSTFCLSIGLKSVRRHGTDHVHTLKQRNRQTAKGFANETRSQMNVAYVVTIVTSYRCHLRNLARRAFEGYSESDAFDYCSSDVLLVFLVLVVEHVLDRA